jgi:hypothetical protein
MNNLWLFGDSFTAGHGCTSGWEYYENYYTEGDLLWGNILGKKLNLKVNNEGLNGSSNDKIIDRLIDNWKSIKKDDVVIVGVSYHHRYDVPIEGHLQSIVRDFLEKNNNKLTDDEFQTLVNFQYYFSNNILYKERQHKRVNFLKNRLVERGVKVIMWNVETDIKGIHTIREATKKEINDGHFSFLGHKQFAKKMLSNHFFIGDLI